MEAIFRRYYYHYDSQHFTSLYNPVKFSALYDPQNSVLSKFKAMIDNVIVNGNIRHEFFEERKKDRASAMHSTEGARVEQPS